jgi:hypothetical protein
MGLVRESKAVDPLEVVLALAVVGVGALAWAKNWSAGWWLVYWVCDGLGLAISGVRRAKRADRPRRPQQ